MIKKRIFKKHNYKSFWYNGKTIRMAIDQSKPIKELEYPEFYDVKITGYCKGGCPYCYMNSTDDQTFYYNCIEKINDFFGNMTKNQRPYQVAIGGGEPTTHPDFIDILKAFRKLDIEPNYTTNGMVDDDILCESCNYCGGVALSCHKHLERYWKSAALKYYEKTPLNFHLVISDKESIDWFVDIFDEYKHMIDFFVLLPYVSQGRAKKKDIDWEYLLTKLPENQSNIAFGAGFYSYLFEGNHNINVSLYEPEIMSKFLDMKDMSIYSSSFSNERIN